MKLSVRDFLSRGRWGELDTDTGALTRLVEAPSEPKEKGYFMRLGDAEVSFCAEGGKLMLVTEAARVALADAKVEHAGEELRTLRVQQGGEQALRLSYPSPINPPMEFDFTMAEEEDFDLGLFVKNVLTSEKRKTLMLKKWS